MNEKQMVCRGNCGVVEPRCPVIAQGVVCPYTRIARITLQYADDESKLKG
jgi:hypothetical protein